MGPEDMEVANARHVLAQLTAAEARTYDGGGGLTSGDFPGTYDALGARTYDALGARTYDALGARTYDALVAPPSPDLAAQLRDPESTIERNVNRFLRHYETEQHTRADPRSLPLSQQPMGALASNTVSALLDTVQEVTSAPALTVGGVLAAITRPDRAAYLGIVCVVVGAALVLLDVEA